MEDDDDDVGFDTHHLLFGSPGPKKVNGGTSISYSNHSDLEGGGDSFLQTSLLERNDSLPTAHSLHAKLHAKPPAPLDGKRGISMGSVSSQDGGGSYGSSSSNKNKKKKGNKQSSSKTGQGCFPCCGNSNKQGGDDDDDDSIHSMVEDKSDDGFYEVQEKVIEKIINIKK
jgi:hypothetical protein